MPLREQISGFYDADIQTNFGLFRVHADYFKFPGRDDAIITLNIGGKDDCLTFSIPIGKNEPVKLAYAEASSDRAICTLDGKEIKGNSTNKMMHLGFTLVKEITRQPIVELDDMSHFSCSLPDGSKHEVALAPFMFVFHGQTWYEKNFGARLVNDADNIGYNNLKSRLHDPMYKPATFDFNKNESLQNLLGPFYMKSKTWADFFELISSEFGKNKCSIVYSWIDKALREHIFKNNFKLSGNKWAINVEYMPIIKYTISKVYSTGEIIQNGGSTNYIDIIDLPYERKSMLPISMRKIDYSIYKRKKHTRKNKRHKV